MLPLIPLFDSPEVVFHLMDVHESSLDSCRRLVHRLGLEASIVEYVAGDATVDLEINHPVHMVITETMQAALGRSRKSPYRARSRRISQKAVC